MYVDFESYTFILRIYLRERVTHPRRRKVVWSILLLYPFPAIVDFVCFGLDHVLYPGFRRVEVRAPIFVLGSARSGTTHTHRLLGGDPGRFSNFRTWEILLPSIVQKKLVRAIGRFDERFLGGRIARKISRAAIEKIYRRFGLEISEEYAAFLADEQSHLREPAPPRLHRHGDSAQEGPRAPRPPLRTLRLVARRGRVAGGSLRE